MSETSTWPVARACEWYSRQAWPVGVNFTPSTACNQLEFWEQPDWVTIERELRWLRQKTQMNLVRVFLHHLVWQQNPTKFYSNIKRFLQLCDQHKIKVMFVLFDDVWNPNPRLGPYPATRPHVHNSRWAQCPGREVLLNEHLQDTLLKDYVQGVVKEFEKDQRILIWDLYNEPGNPNYGTYYMKDISFKAHRSIALLKKVNQWVREIGPCQPLTSAVWRLEFPLVPKFILNWLINQQAVQSAQLSVSDIVTFHSYAPLKQFKAFHEELMHLTDERPMLCTEYLARSLNSKIQTHLPYAHEHKLGMVNWGWVAGRIQTQYSWSTWIFRPRSAPTVWFHDFVHADGTPYDQDEIDVIKQYMLNKS